MAKRELDNIERDVIAAMALGYGVHYGNYKADHPHTKDVPAEEIPADHLRRCRYCGRIFSTHGRHFRKLYCDDECRQAYNSRQEYQKKLKREMMRSV